MQTIYLSDDDTIDSIAEKIKNGKEKEINLVILSRAIPVLSVVNLKMFKKIAESLKRNHIRRSGRLPRAWYSTRGCPGDGAVGASSDNTQTRSDHRGDHRGTAGGRLGADTMGAASG